MGRPTYETSADIDAETEVALLVAERWKATAHKLKKFYSTDWALIRNEVVMAFIEIKCRNNPRDKYPTLILSLDKVISMKNLASVSGKPVFLVVKYTDAICYTQNLRPESIRLGGRTDRNDAQDIEPVIHIPVRNFKTLAI